MAGNPRERESPRAGGPATCPTAPGCRGTCRARRRRSPGGRGRSRASAGWTRDGKKRPGRRLGAAGRRGEGGDGAGGRARALRGPARGGHGQGRPRVREERAARGRDRGACRCREAVAGASGASGGTYGHGRAAARADAGSEPGGRVGGRAAHGITGGEGLVARVARRRRRHGSYGGGVPGAPPNLLRDERGRRDLGADAPNEKWVTDAAGFRIPAGKACLSPIVGRLDGMPPGRAVSTSPDAEMANSARASGRARATARPRARTGAATIADRGGSGSARRTAWPGRCRGGGRGPDNARRGGLIGRPETGLSCGRDRGGAATGELAGMPGVARGRRDQG